MGLNKIPTPFIADGDFLVYKALRVYNYTDVTIFRTPYQSKKIEFDKNGIAILESDSIDIDFVPRLDCQQLKCSVPFDRHAPTAVVAANSHSFVFESVVCNDQRCFQFNLILATPKIEKD